MTYGDPFYYRVVDGPAAMHIFGRITWYTAPADAGEHDVEIEVRDDRGGTALQSFTLDVGPDEHNAAFRMSGAELIELVGQRR